MVWQPALLAALSPTMQAVLAGLVTPSPTAPKSTDGFMLRAGPSAGPWQLSFTYSNSFPIHIWKLTLYMRKMRCNEYDGPNADSNSDSSSH